MQSQHRHFWAIALHLLAPVPLGDRPHFPTPTSLGDRPPDTFWDVAH
ncbi:hypothetical protein HNI00_01435 [Thermoleptolyngbya oregonensis NK1-22]|uniref:Uncharacterized protein n=1 Tax=Thermoleptolyngbya oregonensis NK1-22 TaxID=2547457 RepID=A0AA96Y8F8_9CYAN|nr:hypothetical protein [Thermoleptolyngbya oregonensis]WOB41975.1 hypothetical protein HNI00_01435 [Thermoleptolyngbya oregonensis NK1-22]